MIERIQAIFQKKAPDTRDLLQGNTIPAIAIRPSSGVRVGLSHFGYYVSAAPGVANFSHPFTPRLASNSISFSAGYVNSEFVPVIRTDAGALVPITGDDKNGVPSLTLNSDDIDGDTQQSWVCLEVTPNDDGSLDKNSLIQITHRDSPTSIDEKIGRQPLALILWNNGKPLKAYPQVWFNLRYARTTPQSAGNGLPRHFFL